MRTRPSTGRARPRVSVVIPCYNYGRFLERAVGSVLTQDGLDVDVLIIDDRSTDGSDVTARLLASRHPNVRALVHDENCGHIATYNEGLAMADGEYLLLLSADDLVTTGALTRAVHLMERRPSVGLVYGYSSELFGDATPDDALVADRLRGARTSSSAWAGHAWVEACCRQGKNMVNTPEAVMRADVFREIGGYEPDFPHAADFYLWLRAAARSDVGRVNGVVQARYRIHGRNMHLTDFPEVITDLRERRRAFARLFGSEPSLAARGPELAALADKGMADEALRLAIGAATSPSPDHSGARAFADLAQDLHPSIVETLRWRYLDRLLAPGPRTTAGRVSAGPVRAYQAVQARYRWRRWRRTGL